MRAIWRIWLVIVVLGSLLPGNSTPLQELNRLAINDKVEHFGAYALLAAILPMVWRERRRAHLATLSALVLMGILMELAQFFVPGRTPDIMDALADALGVAAGALAGYFLDIGLRRLRSHPHHT